MLDLEKHRLTMVQILKDIFTDISLENLLGFKGGTAAYLLHDLPRFSVDLDFDLLSPAKEEEVFYKVGQILRSYGKITEQQQKRFTLFFLLSYEKHQRNIKVKISRRIFPSHYENRTFLGILLQVMVKEDLFAHKLVTLLERKEMANRDLFDLWFFARNKWDINKELVELRTKLPFKQYLHKCLERIEKINERKILHGLGELLNDKLKEWVKSNLKKELLFFLKARFLLS
jgi:predicted nucleotidyltransferase component of viral defense system